MRNRASIIFNCTFIICCCLLSLLPYMLMALSAFNTSVDIKKGDIFSHPSFINFAANFNALLDNGAFFSAIETHFLCQLAQWFWE